MRFVLDGNVRCQKGKIRIGTNPKISTNGELTVWCAFLMQTDRAMALFEHSRLLNPHIPGYYFLTPFMAHAYRAEYEQALSYAQQIRMPDLFPDPIARAAALCFLDRQDEAGTPVAELFQLVPDFKESGRETIQRIFRVEFFDTIMLFNLTIK